MKVEFRVEGQTLDDLERNARTEAEQMAEGREFTLQLGEVYSSRDRDFPSPVSRMSAGYAPRTFSTHVTAVFEDRAAAST